MEITVGIDKFDDIIPLINSGADTFFCGVLQANHAGLQNHRPGNKTYNFESIDELKKGIELTHRLGKKIFLVVNETRFSQNDVPSIVKNLLFLDQLHLDAFIVADLTLIKLCQENKIKTKLHLSSLANCYNSEIVEFYRELGVKRIIVPQQVTPQEYQSTYQKLSPAIETEVFFHLYNSCTNIDGFCRYHNTELFTYDHPKLPLMPCIFSPTIKSNYPDTSSYPKKLSLLLGKPPAFDHYGYLYEFSKLGVDSVKLGIRGFPLAEKQKRVAFLKQLLDQVGICSNKKNFTKVANQISHQYQNITWNEVQLLKNQYKLT